MRVFWDFYDGEQEVMALLYYPILKDWELYFDRANGYDNRANVVKTFTDFWKARWFDRIEVPGKCVLGGKVFGSERFIDGDEIFTSNVKLLERIGREEICGVRHDLIRATTESGSEYYFYSDEHNAYMFLMLSDMIHLGEISPSKVYLRSEFRDSNFI